MAEHEPAGRASDARRARLLVSGTAGPTESADRRPVHPTSVTGPHHSGSGGDDAIVGAEHCQRLLMAAVQDVVRHVACSQSITVATLADLMLEKLCARARQLEAPAGLRLA
jgi:hypothetical protein